MCDKQTTCGTFTRDVICKYNGEPVTDEKYFCGNITKPSTSMTCPCGTWDKGDWAEKIDRNTYHIQLSKHKTGLVGEDCDGNCGWLSFSGYNTYLYAHGTEVEDIAPWKFHKVDGEDDTYYIENRWRCKDDPVHNPNEHTDSYGRCGALLYDTGGQTALKGGNSVGADRSDGNDGAGLLVKKLNDNKYKWKVTPDNNTFTIKAYNNQDLQVNMSGYKPIGTGVVGEDDIDPLEWKFHLE